MIKWRCKSAPARENAQHARRHFPDQQVKPRQGSKDADISGNVRGGQSHVGSVADDGERGWQNGIVSVAGHGGHYAPCAAVVAELTEINSLPCAEVEPVVGYGNRER